MSASLTLPHKAIMSVYLLIETRSTYESQEVGDFLNLAAQLGEDGHTVDLFLIQNGVLMAQANAEPRLSSLISKGIVSVYSDDFSLTNRSLKPTDLIKGIEIVGMARLVKLLTRPDCKPIWH